VSWLCLLLYCQFRGLFFLENRSFAPSFMVHMKK
jgi:hypothetical protein